ncbi:MAG: sulfatase-like hydrolase/transferase, partial [Actinobacteria bacterium]|nr:sulfatase-like hydrolase/transferase [Actinomycetota bacterium]
MRLTRRLTRALSALALAATSSCVTTASHKGTPPPNVIVFVTDDQRASGTMLVMPEVKRWFSANTTRFPNAFATTPLCCPSRASIMTGRYAHNHGVRHNHQSHTLDQSATVQHHLRKEGYSTAIAGKYLNQ